MRTLQQIIHDDHQIHDNEGVNHYKFITIVHCNVDVRTLQQMIIIHDDGDALDQYHFNIDVRTF